MFGKIFSKQKSGENTCMACSCPCDMHKEHTHGEAKKCEHCGHTHKSNGSCDCGCK